MNPADDSFRRQLTRAREFGGVSQQALADYLGVSKSTVNRWETGENPMPSLRYQRRGLIAEVLELTGAPKTTFTEPPASDRVAELEEKIDRLQAQVQKLSSLALDADEEAEFQRYLPSVQPIVKPGREGASE